jgi:tetratricopeptide (TPR) repeat protein
MSDAPDLIAAGPRGRASAAKHAWSHGAPPDALAVLEQDPELLADKAAVIDLAYEEFCRRTEAGDVPDAEAFVARFPAFQSSLRRVLRAHLFLMDNGALLEEPAPRWPEAGERLGDLTLVRELGRGAFARVFLATEASTGDRPVAVKLSREGSAEARTLGPLNHPNIVPVLSARKDESTGLTAVCMPYLGSATLEDVLERAFPAGAAAPERAALILDVARSSPAEGDAVTADRLLARGSYAEGVMHLGAQVADALAYMHGQGVCHRDLKPSNVLLGPGGRPLLLDFNLSADAEAVSLHMGGTLPYMAPEQLEAFLAGGGAGAPRLDGRADLFSLGVILYELLTGRHPFGPVPVSKSSKELARFLLERHRGGCLRLRRAGRGVDRRLARLIEGCLAFSPSERPVSAKAMAAALRRLLGPLARLRRWAARRPFAAAGLAALLALTGGGAVLGGSALVRQVRPSTEREHQRGLAAYRAGDLVTAEEWFSQTVRLENNQVPEHLFDRGLVRMKRAAGMTDPSEKDVAFGLFDLAVADFEASLRRQPAAGPAPAGQTNEGEVYACMAYCRARQGQFWAAIEFSNKATDHGYATAEVWNNLAYCYSRVKDGADKARPALKKALQLNPDLPAARYNRAVAAYNARATQGLLGPADHPLLPQVLEDIEQGLVTKPAGSQPYRYAAHLYAFALKDLPADEKAKDRYAKCAIHYLKETAARGVPVASIKADPLIRAVFSGLPELDALPTPRQRLPEALSAPELAEPPTELR